MTMNQTKTSAHEVWVAVIDGANTAPLVAERVGVSRGHAAMHLRIMHEIGLLRRSVKMLPSEARYQSAGVATYVFEPDHDVADRLGW